MINLDNYPYSIHLTKYQHEQNKYAGLVVGWTGAPIAIETGAFSNTYTLTLICTKNDLAALRATYAKALFTNNLLDFTDEEGVSWLSGAGSSDSTHIYSSGVFFHGPLKPEPMTVVGWNSANRFLVPITLTTNSSGLASAGSGPVTGGNVSLVHEVPGGTINGVNNTFTLSQAPATLILFKNGVEQKAGVDYTLSSSTITFLAGATPQTGDSLDSYYV